MAAIHGEKIVPKLRRPVIIQNNVDYEEKMQ